ncbi:MAG: hypothetical protein ACYSSI_03945 [Planctomycetota bacterium]|jgi:hypothetical protein
MAKKELTNYQRDVISRYHNNLNTIMLQKLQELVTELYLADNAAKKERLWQRAHKAMLKLKIKPAIINHIMKTRSEEILAMNLKDWLSEKPKA